MKPILHLLFFAFIANVLFAQKVDMDKKSMAILHSYFPNSPVLSPFKTYESRISEPAGFLSSHGMNRVMVIQNFVKMGGYQRVEAGGEFILDIILDGIQYVENKTMTNSTTDKAGKTNYSYYYSLKFFIPISLRILDASQKSITTKEIRNTKSVAGWTSNIYASRAELDSKIKSDWNQILSTEISKYIETAIKEMSSGLTKEYGFYEEKDWVVFYELDSKSHPEYENYMKHIQLMETEFKSFKPGMDVEAARKRLKGSIDYFCDLIPKLNKDDKHQFKLLKHTYINLMNLNYYTDDFNEYNKYNTALGAIEGKGYWDESRLLERENNYKNMKAYGANSIYFVRDLQVKSSTALTEAIASENKTEEPKPKSSTQEIDLSRLKRNPMDRVLTGQYISSDGIETKGYFTIGSGEDDMIFNGSIQNTYFVYLNEKGDVKTKPIHPKKLKSFMIDNRQFKIINYKGSGLGSSKSPAIMEVLKENPSIHLYKYYPEDGDAETSKEYAYVFIKTSDEKVISYTGKDMFWKKKAKEYFASCPGILEEIEKLKYISPNKTVTQKWADLYEGCNK